MSFQSPKSRPLDPFQSPLAGQWIDLCSVADVPESGDGHYVEVDRPGFRRGLAVFRRVVDGQVQFHVVDNACPHAGGSLAGGHIEDDCVLCPWHHWAFELKSGQCPDAPRFRVRVYPARTQGPTLQIQV